ncbi:hypothetical protein ER308_17745 [Egibacter rhizosphaerae]|uniref:Uncharacterized protein n=1 Tax=Egibacter rhizosphaerae TaxID=1670831 RepID=A0A411YJ20_9ACTN|nr:hypothetical protein [Egibacter rhizosphaerae]QBI21230.1 hypothetical protein ER308_17745 [Egibacter rhizosphaerae]
MRLEQVSRDEADRVDPVAPIDRTPQSERQPGSWDEALATFRDVLDEVETRLASERWEDAAEALAELPMTVPEGEPGPSERAAGQELIDRSERLQTRLRRSMEATRSELDELGQRRHAARQYLAQSADEGQGA